MDDPKEQGAPESNTGTANGPADVEQGEPPNRGGASRIPGRPMDAGGEARPLFGRGAMLALTVWGVMALGVTGGIAEATPLWPVVPVLGVILPLGFVLLAAWHSKNQMEAPRGREIRAVLVSDERAERELLGALLQSDGLTPSSAAARISLGVSQAAEVLEGLAAKGHLDVTARDGDLVYALRDAGSRTIPKADGADGLPHRGEKSELDPPVEPPVEPLSEREVEVMRLLASGKTNREIAHELYVSHGTVKAHTASIYRKLGAHNRAEMVNRAKALDLLG